MTFFEDPLALALTLPPLALALVVFTAALLEFVVPPFPGDSIMLLGFFLAAQGSATPEAIFLAALAGGTIGSILAFSLSERYGESVFERLPVATRRRSWSRRQVRRLLDGRGEIVLVVNRFLPVVRGAMLYAAGTLRLRRVPSIMAAAVSNVAFVSLLFWLGTWTAGSWEQLQSGLQQLNRGAGIVAVAVVALWLGIAYLRSQAAPAESSLDRFQ